MGFCQQTQIAGRLILENTCHISYNTIYRAIYAGMFDEPGLSHGNRGASENCGTKVNPGIQRSMMNGEVKSK